MIDHAAFISRRIDEKRKEMDEIIKGLPSLTGSMRDEEVRRLAEAQAVLDKWNDIYNYYERQS